jgi:hypothetical protein
VNERHEIGRTALHWAAFHGETSVCTFLLDRDAKINSQDEELKTALHLACEFNHAGCAELLISKEADTNIKDRFNRMPHEYARGNLRNIVQFAKLYSGGTVRLECLKICLMGDERAGKTTLAKAIKRTWEEHLSSLEEMAEDSKDICERTAGMTIYKATISSMGPTVVCDFAGQELFHHTHNMFFDESNSLCIVVVSGLLSKREMFGQCRRWAAFLTAASHPGAIPVVTVVVSRRDSCSNIFQVEAMTQGVVTELRGMFKSVLSIQERFFILDCRKSQSPEMVEFRVFMGELKEQKLETVKKYPSLVEPVIKVLLPQLKEKPSTKLIEKDHFTSLVKKELKLKPVRASQLVDGTFAETIEFLHASGEAFLIKDLALLDIPWMSHSLLGPVMAPLEFPEHLEAAESQRRQGAATKEEICTVIKNFHHRQSNFKAHEEINTEYATKAMESLEVMFELEGNPGVYCIPAHLPSMDRSKVWQKSTDPQMCYVGRRMECLRDIDVFTLAFFVFLQSRMALVMDRNAILYKGGIKITQVAESSIIVQCLVELTKYNKAIDVIARANNHGRQHALKLLQQVHDIVLQVLNEKSPGTLTRRFLLHVNHLIEAAPEPFGFPEEEVEAIKAEGKEVIIGVHGCDHITCSLKDLMAVDLSDTKSEQSVQSVCKMQFHTPASPSMLGFLSGLQLTTAVAETPQMRSGEHRGSASWERKNELKTPSDPCTDLRSVKAAVLKCAPHEWYSIGLQLGFSDGQLIDLAHTLGTGHGKLERIVEVKAAEAGMKATAGMLLDACERLTNPVIGAVREFIKQAFLNTLTDI